MTYVIVKMSEKNSIMFLALVIEFFFTTFYLDKLPHSKQPMPFLKH